MEIEFALSKTFIILSYKIAKRHFYKLRFSFNLTAFIEFPLFSFKANDVSWQDLQKCYL